MKAKKLKLEEHLPATCQFCVCYMCQFPFKITMYFKITIGNKETVQSRGRSWYKDVNHRVVYDSNVHTHLASTRWIGK